jgi:DNA-binding transcriptional LysR family regulator
MNIKQLEHLLAVAEHRSFSRAAERMFITQSALSRSIAALEDELGALLFDRVGKRVELTPLGTHVAARAAELVRDAIELRRSVDIFQGGKGGILRVGLGSGPAAMLTTPLLCHMAEHHPRVRVRVTGGPVALQLMQLRTHGLDALIADARSIEPAADLVAEPIGDLRTCFACRTDHPLARQAAVTLVQILAYPVASTPLSDEIARLLVELYGPEALPEKMTTLQCDDVPSLVRAVVSSPAVFLGLAAAVREEIGAGTLVELAVIPALAARARFACVTLAGRTEAPVMAAFRRFAAERLMD